MVNMQKLKDLIGQKPGIRTVELSDRLDCDIEEINAAMADELERGSCIVKHNVIAPNGRRAFAYTLMGVPLPDSLTPAPTKELTIVEKAIVFIQGQPDKQATGAQLHGALEMKDADAPSVRLAAGLEDGRLVKEGKYWTVGPVIGETAQPVAEIVNSTMENPAPELAKPVTKNAKTGGTKIELAIEFLKKNGKSTSDDLRTLLGIKKKQTPRAYLFNALMAGTIIQQGNSWWVPGYETVKYPPVDPEIPSFVPQAAPVVAENPADIRREFASHLKQLEQSAIETALVVMHNSTDVQEAEVVAEPPVEAVKPEVQTTILDNSEGVTWSPRPPRIGESNQDHKDRGLWEFKDAPEFVVALLSNSNLEIRQDGKTVTLKKAEWSHMRDFINKVELA